MAALPAPTRHSPNLSWADIENMPISATPLSAAWATVETDIARTLGGQTVRRVLEIEVVGGELRRLLLWLDVADSAHVVLGVQPLDL
jgi:hypothetical protein